MIAEVDQNMEVVVHGEHAARKLSRKQITELRSISNNNNASSSTTRAVMAQHDEELTSHRGTNGIFLNSTKITAIGQFSPQAGYLNAPQALLSNSSYTGHTNRLIASSDPSRIININFEGAASNNINSNYICINNLDLNSNHGFPNTRIVILPQLNNNQIRQPSQIPNIRNEIAVSMIQLTEAPEIAVLSDDSNGNGKCLALSSNGDSNNGTFQKQISLQDCEKEADTLGKEIHCISNRMVDSGDESNGLSDFITISKSNINTISNKIQNDSEDVILPDTNENLNVLKSNDEIGNLQTLSSLNESSSLSTESKSTRFSSSLSTLSVNRNDSFLSKPSYSQTRDKECDKMLSRESNVNINKSNNKILVEKESLDVQNFISEKHEESSDNQNCVDLESQMNDTMSTVLENEVADDLVEILTGLDSSPQEDRRSIHCEKITRTVSELLDLPEYNFDCNNASVYGDKNEETERRNSESTLEEKEILRIKMSNVSMEPSEYKKDACYFKEFLKLDYTSTDSQELKFSTQQKNSYRDVKHEDDYLSEEASMDLRLDSFYHGLFKRNVIRQSSLNPLFSKRTLLENDMRTVSISAKHEIEVWSRRNNKEKEESVHESVNVTTEKGLDKISSIENSERRKSSNVLSTESNYLVRHLTFPRVKLSTVITDRSDVKKLTSQLYGLRNQRAPYSRSSELSHKKRPRKRNSVKCQMEGSVVNHPNDFLQYSSQDERRVEQENHSQLEVANGEDLGQLKNDSLKNSSGFRRRVQNLISEANVWIQDTTIRGKTRSQSRSKQNEANQMNDSSINCHDTISTRTVAEAPENKSKKSKSKSQKLKNSRKSDAPKNSVAKKIKRS